MAVSPEGLDKYVGVYSSPEAPARLKIIRRDTTLFVQPGTESAARMEATTEDKYQIGGGRIVFEFDATRKQMIQKRGGLERHFTKEE